MKTLLVTAYDVNPFKGSESGTGWNFIAQLSRFFRVIAVTRENNRGHIERYLRENGLALENLRFVYFDLPPWVRWWKRGARGSSVYFYLWQFGVARFVRAQRFTFDAAHNLNFHADWAPSFLWMLGKPLIWGPIGHHPKIPTAFIAPYGWREWLKDRARWALKSWFWRVDPFLQLCKRKARLILCVNSDVSKHLRPPADRVVIHSAVGAHDEGPTAPREGKVFRILSVGRFIPLKGFDVALAAFARFHDGLAPAEREGVELVLVGAGPQEARLKALAARPGVSGRTRFVTWMERAELMDVYREATCFLFPSHEGAGMVVAEALSFGLPVVCFDNAGPGELMDGDSGIRVPYGRYEEAVAGFAAALQRLHSDRSLRARLSAGARRRFETWLDWNAKGEQLRKQIEGMAI